MAKDGGSSNPAIYDLLLRVFLPPFMDGRNDSSFSLLTILRISISNGGSPDLLQRMVKKSLELTKITLRDFLTSRPYYRKSC